MGGDHQSKLKAQAADIAKSACHDGKARNFSHSRFASRLNNAFGDLENPGSRRWRRRLFDAINDPKLEAPIAVLKARHQ